ncbi:MAG: MCP four helix bundle domain-containing protein [Microscillaceae bacterium]|jgi:hypothetical protein|nr:MCP four helix bundle domain-containing protein [Microscillaceae bacterium]
MAKFFPKLKNRTSIITSYTILIIIIVTVGLVGAAGLNRIIYISDQAKDNLIPAVESAKIAEKLYQNRLYVEQHIASSSGIEYQSIEGNINRNYRQIDSLVVVYSEIYSARESENNLLKYRNQIVKYRGLERQVIQLSRITDKKQAQAIFLGQSVEMFQSIIEPIHSITDYHIRAGEQKYQSAKVVAGYIKLVLYMSIGLAFVTLVILGTIAGFSFMSD